jgi:hypothetical protein
VRSAGQAIRYWVLRRNRYMVIDLGYQVGPITLGLQGRWIGKSVERSPNHHQAQQACHDLASHLVACPRARRQSVLLAIIPTLGFRLRYITLDWLQKEHSIGHPRIPLDLVSSPARSKKTDSTQSSCLRGSPLKIFIEPHSQLQTLAIFGATQTKAGRVLPSKITDFQFS